MLLSGFVILIHVAFFIYALQKNDFYLLPDSQEYLNQRDNLVHHQSIYQGSYREPHRWYLETRRPPLTGIILSGIFLFSESDTTILIFQNLISIVVLIATLSVLLRLYPSIHPLLLIAPVLFFPSQFIYCNYIMAEVFFQAFLFAGFGFLLRSETKNNLLVFFFFITLAAFVKPIIYLVWLPLAAAMVLFWKKWNLKLSAIAAPLMMAAVVSGFSFYNFQRTGVFAFSSASESFLPDYVVLPVVHVAEGQERAMKVNEQIHFAAQACGNYPCYHKTLMSESRAVLNSYPFTTSLLWIKGMLQFFIDAGRWDCKVFFFVKPGDNPDGLIHHFMKDGLTGAFVYLHSAGIMEVLTTIAGAIFHLFMTLSFLIFLSDKNYPLLFRVFACVVVFYLALLTGPIGSARYRMAVYPLLLLAFPSGVALIKKWICRT